MPVGILRRANALTFFFFVCTGVRWIRDDVHLLKIMLKSCLRHPWFTGVATALVAAAAVYMTSGEPGSSTNKNKPSRDRTKARRSKPSGLINEGNTCFINAVLQALASCRAFTFWMATVVQEQQDHTNDLRTLSSLHTTITGINIVKNLIINLPL